MSFRQFISCAGTRLSSRPALLTAILAALLLVGKPAPLQAGPCPPCSGDANECAWSCCVYQDCHSWNIMGCVAYCNLGYIMAKATESDGVAPAFKSFAGQTQAHCSGDNRIGAIDIPPAGLRNTKKRLEVGLLSLVDRQFLRTAGDVVSVMIETVRKDDYFASKGQPRWAPLGRAVFSPDAGVWVFDWNLAGHDANTYFLRALATRKDGRVIEARGIAASPRD